LLKWAQTANGFIGSGTAERLLISGAAANRWVHQWRGEEAAIMVGSGTAMLDNPQLTNRSGGGRQPVRIILDKNLRLPHTLQVFDGSVNTIMLNYIKSEEDNVSFVRLNPDLPLPQAVCAALFSRQIQSVMIEGGAALLSLFIEAGCWDEARVITSKKRSAANGVGAPTLTNALPYQTMDLEDDTVTCYYHQNKSS
jgi:diaminohydroxyphosphoribosylaminopyrimidine deaminase/5-amino-6-(5-phosphoribosylamino)uracil reductase